MCWRRSRGPTRERLRPRWPGPSVAQGQGGVPAAEGRQAVFLGIHAMCFLRRVRAPARVSEYEESFGEGVDVCSLSSVVAAGLTHLRGDEVGGPDFLSLLGQASRLGEGGDPEVSQYRFPAVPEEVVGLDVPVVSVLFGQRGERPGQVPDVGNDINDGGGLAEGISQWLCTGHGVPVRRAPWVSSISQIGRMPGVPVIRCM